MSLTLFEKLWKQHRVETLSDGSALIYIDRIFLHERTGSIALTSLAENGRAIRNPKHAFCTMDHIVDTFPGRTDKTLMPGGTEFITTTRTAARNANIRLFDINDSDQGISHLVSAEQGITLPGLTVVCPDSHTCTLGALGAMAWGIGSSDCEHALATQTLRIQKPKQMRVNFTGQLGVGVTAKDMILTLIRQLGSSGGEGMVVEYAGPVVEQLDIEARFTLCNMSTEFSAFSGIIAPDETTINYVSGRTYTPKGKAWEKAQEDWQNLFSDEDAVFDKEVTIDCSQIEPLISWGTSPEQSISIQESIPAVFGKNSHTSKEKSLAQKQALEYMGIGPNQSLLGLEIDGAFIGSCTNGRLSDLQAAADVLRGRRVSSNVKAVCTPGSARVKKAAEDLGLDKIFLDAGFEWREPGCSLCFYAGGEGFSEGQRVISTTNRNFRGRQGRGTRTHITSPVMVAAAAISGKIVDCRDYINVLETA